MKPRPVNDRRPDSDASSSYVVVSAPSLVTETAVQSSPRESSFRTGKFGMGACYP